MLEVAKPSKIYNKSPLNSLISIYLNVLKVHFILVNYKSNEKIELRLAHSKSLFKLCL